MSSVYRWCAAGVFLLTVSTAIGGCDGRDKTIFVTASNTSPAAASLDADVAIAWFDLAYDAVKTASMPPPVASRVYGYTGVTLYEAVVHGMAGYQSLVGQLAGLAVPQPLANNSYNWEVVANKALATVLRSFFASNAAVVASINALENDFNVLFQTSVNPGQLSRSEAFGQQVGEAIIAWAGEDGFAELNNCAFTPPVGPGLWVPTPPGFAAPLQPCWGQLRPFSLIAGAECDQGPPPEFSTVNGSAMFNEAFEVYQTGINLTAEQKDIATYWADGPGVTGTPAGHSISICTQVLSNFGESLDVAAVAYAKLGMAVADAFIACWDAKYQYNLLRPVTYIRDNIDPTWSSFIGTPNFPEYTSGHSAQSGAAAEILTDMFGPVAFTDHTHDDRGFAPRHFDNFEEAFEEAAISRLYGGIHYRVAIDNGLVQGSCVAQQVLAIRFLSAEAGPTAPVADFDSSIAADWFDLTRAIFKDNGDAAGDQTISPPVSSRACGYLGLGLYEALVPGIPGNQSLAGQVNGLTPIQDRASGKQLHWPSVVNAVLPAILRSGAIPSISTINKGKVNDLEANLNAVLVTQTSDSIFRRSQAHGRAVAKHIAAYLTTDGFATFNNCAYTEPPPGNGNWERTPPALAAPLQPCWGQMRTFVLDSGSACDPGGPPEYSEVVGSAFYNEGLEVQVTKNNLTAEQKTIAFFWADGGGTGTPPGHSISILTQVLIENDHPLDIAAEAYARLGMAQADAFISCWETKYAYNLLRPITYIRNEIEPGWNALFATPPFPEYTSGHSTQSGAMARVMTDMFGEVAFTDHTQDALIDTSTAAPFVPREFDNFFEAAEEAAISRLYGGIHYRAAIELGLEQGECIGEQVSALEFQK